MNDEFRHMVIETLRRGEELPAEWARELFPPEKREYELLYYGKEREEDIRADTMAVPLQPASTFGGNGETPSSSSELGWHNMLIFGDNLQALKTLLEQKKAGQLCNAFCDEYGQPYNAPTVSCNTFECVDLVEEPPHIHWDCTCICWW